jgi:uncharacterized membrane protein
MSDAKTTMPSIEDLNSALTQVSKKLSLGFFITHGSFALFLVLITWFNFQPIGDTEAQNLSSSIKLWLVKILPLVIFIPGFITRKYRTYSWLCFGILPYFIWITPLVMARGAWSDWVMTILIVVLFIASMMTSRWMQQQSYLGWQISQTPSN